MAKAVFHYKPQAIVQPLENSTLKSLKALAYSETEMVIKKRCQQTICFHLDFSYSERPHIRKENIHVKGQT